MMVLALAANAIVTVKVIGVAIYRNKIESLNGYSFPTIDFLVQPAGVV